MIIKPGVAYHMNSIGANKQLFIGPDVFVYRLMKEVRAFVGRGEQKGIKIGGVVYDEIPEAHILMAIRDEDRRTLKIVP